MTETNMPTGTSRSTASKKQNSGCLYLAATPIGNDADASFRLKTVLKNADIVAAEDTRRAGLLLKRLEIELKPNARLVSCYDHNESKRIPDLINAIANGQEVVLISDAGMPTVSDPGFALAQAVIEAELSLTVIPGPSAVLTALAISGLPADRFTFEGFLPRKTTKQIQYLTELAKETRTMIFFESPRRLTDTLNTMAEVMGKERKAAVCRELTKTYEEVWRGTLKQLAQRTDNVRGEIVIVVSGIENTTQEISKEQALKIMKKQVQQGERTKEAAKNLAKNCNWTAKELYQLYLENRD